MISITDVPTTQALSKTERSPTILREVCEDEGSTIFSMKSEQCFVTEEKSILLQTTE